MKVLILFVFYVQKKPTIPVEINGLNTPKNKIEL